MVLISIFFLEGYVPIIFILLDGFAHRQFFTVFSFSPQELSFAAKGFVPYLFFTFLRSNLNRLLLSEFF